MDQIAGLGPPVPLQPRHPHPAVHRDDRAGGVGEVASGDGGYHLAHVLWLAPAGLEGEAVGEQGVVPGSYSARRGLYTPARLSAGRHSTDG